MTLRTSLLFVFLIAANSLFSQTSTCYDSQLFATTNNGMTDWKIKSEKGIFYLANYRSLPFSSLSNDSLSMTGKNTSLNGKSSCGNKWLKAGIVPLGLAGVGVITMLVPENTLFSKYSVQQRIMKTYPRFSTTMDNYLQYVPGVAVFGLKALGVKSRSDLLNQSIILAKSQLLQTALVLSLKSLSHINRPDGAGYQAMPSGHSAQAFQLATMLDMEYRDDSPWIGVSGYAVATATGALRMLNNKHWISDVLVGAGIGIFSTKVVYLTHQYRWKKSSNIVILPAIFNNGGGITFAMLL